MCVFNLESSSKVSAETVENEEQEEEKIYSNEFSDFNWNNPLNCQRMASLCAANKFSLENLLNLGILFINFNMYWMG